MNTWYSNPSKQDLDPEQPIFMQILERSPLQLEEILDCQPLMTEFKTLSSPSDAMARMNHTDPRRYARLERVKKLLSDSFQGIVLGSLRFSLKMFENQGNSSSGSELQKAKFKYPLKSVELIDSLLAIQFDDNHQKTRFLYKKMLQIFLSNDPINLEQTLYPGYFLKLFTLLVSSNVRLNQVIKLVNQMSQETIGLISFARYQEAIEVLSVILDQRCLMKKSGIKEQPSGQSGNSGEINLNISISFSIANAKVEQQQIRKQVKMEILATVLKVLEKFSKQESCVFIEIENLLTLIDTFCQKYHSMKDGDELMSQLTTINAFGTVVSFSQVKTESQLSCLSLSILKHIFLFEKNVRSKELSEIITTYFEFPDNPKETVVIKPSLQHIKIIEVLIAGLKVLNTQKQICDLLMNQPILQHLLQAISKFPSFSIFHKAVESLVHTIFAEKITVLIEFLYEDCDIIGKTVKTATDFKKHQEFGTIFSLAKCYTTMKVDTPKVLRSIQDRLTEWTEFYENVLKPQVQRQDRHLGKIQYMEGTQQWQSLKQMQEKTANQPIKITDCRTNPVENCPTLPENLADLSGSFCKEADMKITKSASFEDVGEGMLLAPIQFCFDLEDKDDMDDKNDKDSQSLTDSALKEISADINIENLIEKPQTKQSFFDYMASRKQQFQSTTSKRHNATSASKRRSTKMKSVDTKKNRWAGNPQPMETQVLQKNSLGKAPPSPSKREGPVPLKLPKIQIVKLNYMRKVHDQMAKQRELDEKTDSRLIKWLKVMKTEQ